MTAGFHRPWQQRIALADFGQSARSGFTGVSSMHSGTRVKNRPATCGLAWTGALVAVLALAGCGGEAYTASPGDPDKPTRACLAVDEATPLEMSPADRAACEDTMRGWYAESWYTRPDPADRYTGEAQLDYLRAKALECRRAADAYRLTGKERWTALMRCLVIVRKR